jgi:uncharacterized lipoprotein YajG
MKKILTLFGLLLLCSCASYKEEILNLNLSINPKYSGFGDNKYVELLIVDDRDNKDLLGKKRLGDDSIEIKSNRDLVGLVRKKISHDLEQNGFLIVGKKDPKPDGKFLEIRILNFNYEANRGFIIGKSTIKSSLKVNALNKNGGEKYSTRHNFSLENNHFVAPSIATDEKTINSTLQEVLDDVLADQKLLEFLKN